MNDNPYSPPHVGVTREAHDDPQVVHDAKLPDGGKHRVEFELSIDDLIEFELHRRGRNRSRKSSRQDAFWQLVKAVLILLFAYVLYKKNEPNRFVWIGAWLSFWLAIFALSYWFRNHAHIRALRKQLRRPEFAEVFQRQIVTIDGVGVEQRSGHSTSTTSWGGITRMDSTERTVLIYLSDEVAVVIPKLAFANPTELEAFVATANHYLEATRAASQR
ncbi:MAG: YcxB family protein [Pirellulales bacterium]